MTELDNLPASIEQAEAPSPVDPAAVRLALGPAAEGLTDEQLRRMVSVVTEQRQQYSGLPAVLMTMAELDNRHGDSRLLDHYVQLVESDQRHAQGMDRREQRTMSVGIFTGQAVTLFIVGGGIAAAALVPDAAVPIMSGVAGVAGVLAGPRLVEAFRGSPEPKPKDDEEDRNRPAKRPRR